GGLPLVLPGVVSNSTRPPNIDEPMRPPLSRNRPMCEATNIRPNTFMRAIYHALVRRASRGARAASGSPMKKTLLEAAAGVAGGILGTLLIRQMAKLGGKLPQRFQPRMHRDPADAVLSKAEALAHRPLAPSTRERLKPWLSFLYGT